MSSDADRLALRLGFGVALGFVLGGLSGTPLFFLPPLLTAQLLAALRQPPTLRQGLGLVILIALIGGATLLVAGAFAGQPLVYAMLVALMIFAGFLLDTAGKAMPATFLLILGCMVPLVATQSVGAAADVAAALVESAAIAIVAVWVMFAAFPAPAAAASAASRADPASPGKALLNTLLLLPVLLTFMVSGSTTFVVLIVIVSVLRLGDRATAHRAALGLLLGNILGGIVATVAYNIVIVQPGVIFFVLVVLLVALTFGGRIAAGGPQAPIFLLALVTFVILLGIGVSPLPTDSGAAFTTRLWNVMLAGAYAVGAISLTAAPRPQLRECRP